MILFLYYLIDHTIITNNIIIMLVCELLLHHSLLRHTITVMEIVKLVSNGIRK